MEKNYVLNLHNAFQQYGDKIILNDISLKIRKGEFVSIVGPTGCGKSTLLRLILGSERPSKGLVEMNGKRIRRPQRVRGVVFQKYSLFDFMTVRMNVTFGLRMESFSLIENLLALLFPFFYKKKRSEFVQEADSYLETFGLLEHAEKYPEQLSGGQRQRAAIAQSMIMKPEILLMDEPLGALDVGTREKVQLFIKDLWTKTNQTIFFVTHDLEEALFMGTRLIVLSQYYEGGKEGSKIVKDIKIPFWSTDDPASIKHSKEFNEIMHDVRLKGLDSSNLQKIAEFDLSHEDCISN